MNSEIIIQTNDSGDIQPVAIPSFLFSKFDRVKYHIIIMLSIVAPLSIFIQNMYFDVVGIGYIAQNTTNCDFDYDLETNIGDISLYSVKTPSILPFALIMDSLILILFTILALIAIILQNISFYLFSKYRLRLDHNSRTDNLFKLISAGLFFLTVVYYLTRVLWYSIKGAEELSSKLTNETGYNNCKFVMDGGSLISSVIGFSAYMSLISSLLDHSIDTQKTIPSWILLSYPPDKSITLLEIMIFLNYDKSKHKFLWSLINWSIGNIDCKIYDYGKMLRNTITNSEVSSSSLSLK